MIPLYEIFRIGKFIETRKWLPGAGEVGSLWGVIANGFTGFFCSDENVLRLMVVMVAHTKKPLPCTI